jgi:hypothetical protein
MGEPRERQASAAGAIKRRVGARVTLNQTAAFLTALIATATVVLHMVGVVSHEFFLRHWGVEVDLFPKSTDWLLIHGYYALFGRFVAGLQAVISEVFMFIGVAIGAGVYVAFLLRISDFDSAPWDEVASKLPPWARVFVRRAALTFLVVLLLPVCLFVLTAFMAIPAALGEAAGTASAEQRAADFEKGCNVSKQRCIELHRNGVAFATGYRLDSSVTRIAIFDVAINKGRAVSREGVEVVSVVQQP